MYINFFISRSSLSFVQNSVRPGTVETPASPTVARSSVPSESRRPPHPAGIVARQHQLAAHQLVAEYDANVIKPIVRALDILCKGCVMCWMNQKNEWRNHLSDNCTRCIGTNYGDPEFSAFRSNAIRLPVGWCYSCLVSQVSLWVYYF